MRRTTAHLDKFRIIHVETLNSPVPATLILYLNNSVGSVLYVTTDLVKRQLLCVWLNDRAVKRATSIP